MIHDFSGNPRPNYPATAQNTLSLKISLESHRWSRYSSCLHNQNISVNTILFEHHDDECVNAHLFIVLLSLRSYLVLRINVRGDSMIFIVSDLKDLKERGFRQSHDRAGDA